MEKFDLIWFDSLIFHITKKIEKFAIEFIMKSEKLSVINRDKTQNLRKLFS